MLLAKLADFGLSPKGQHTNRHDEYILFLDRLSFVVKGFRGQVAH